MKYELPVPQEVAAQMAAEGSPLSEVAALTEAECRERMRERWAALRFPANQALAQYILSLPQLRVYRKNPRYQWQKEGFALVFENGSQRILLPSALRQEIPPSLSFPFARFPELSEFLAVFGGITDCETINSSHFPPPSELRMMFDADEQSAWGLVKPWDGSLVIYQGGTADCIVMRDDGHLGRWHHELAAPVPREKYADFVSKCGMEEFCQSMPGLMEGPVGDLECDFPTLIRSYLSYCQLPEESEAKRESPFYY